MFLLYVLTSSGLFFSSSLGINILGQHVRLWYLLRMRKKHSNTHADVFSMLLDFSLTVKAATLIFISGCGSAI